MALPFRYWPTEVVLERGLVFLWDWESAVVECLQLFCVRYLHRRRWTLTAALGLRQLQAPTRLKAVMKWKMTSVIMRMTVCSWIMLPNFLRSTEHWWHNVASGHIDESVTGLSLSPHRKYVTGCQQNSRCCGWPLLFIVNCKHFCSSLPMDAGKQALFCVAVGFQVGNAIPQLQLWFLFPMLEAAPECHRPWLRAPHWANLIDEVLVWLSVWSEV